MFAHSLPDIIPGVFTWSVITLMLSGCLAFLYPLLRRLMLAYPAPFRTTLIVLIAAAPSLIASIVLVLYASPELSHLFIHEHCHGNVCGAHSLHMPISTQTSAGLVILSVLVLLLMGYLALRQLSKGKRYSATLAMLSEARPNQDFRLIQTEQPAAWCVGLLKPQIYLSQGLIDQVSKQQLQTMLAHEHAHVSRRDNLRKFLVHWFTFPWPRAKAQQIRQDLLQDTENTCDLMAMEFTQTSADELGELLNTVEQYCAEHGKQHQVTSEQRLAAFKHEMRLYQEFDKAHWRRLLLALSGSFLIGAVLFIVAAFVSHPVLEWLSR